MLQYRIASNSVVSITASETSGQELFASLWYDESSSSWLRIQPARVGGGEVETVIGPLGGTWSAQVQDHHAYRANGPFVSRTFTQSRKPKRNVWFDLELVGISAIGVAVPSYRVDLVVNQDGAVIVPIVGDDVFNLSGGIRSESRWLEIEFIFL